MFTRHSPSGVAGYGHESIGEALMQLLDLKVSHRKSYETQIQADPSDIDGFYATLMAEATHASLDRGKKCNNGVFLGDIIDLNEYIKERLGSDARDYQIKADI